MSFINIPNSVLPGIKALGLLTSKELKLVYEVLRKAPKNTSDFSLSESLKEHFQSEQAENLSSVIHSLGYLLSRNENIDGTLSEKIVDSFLNSVEDDDLPKKFEKVLKDRIEELILVSDFLIPGYEAIRIVWATNSVLMNSTVTSEIVLLNDKSYNTPAKGILLNKFNISFKKNGENKEKTYVLDNKDLVSLKNQIENAIKENEEMSKRYSSIITFFEL